MTTYEILLLLDPEQAEARQDEIIARTRELVEKNGGAWHSHDAWGRRRLAYPILHKEEGVYHLVVFDAEPATLEEISRVLKIDDSVLRHLATRHIPGSRTTAPRDEAAVPVVSAAAVSEDAEPEYAGEEEQPSEESGEAGSAADEAGVARPENQGEEE